MFQCHVGLPMVKQPCKANSWWSWSRRLQAELACRPWYAWAPFKSYPLSWGYPNSWMVYNEKFCKKVMVWGVPRLEGHKNCKVAAAGSCFFFPSPAGCNGDFSASSRSGATRNAQRAMRCNSSSHFQSLPVTSSHFQSLPVTSSNSSSWICLKMGYTPNYSHLIGIMIINHWV